nr:MAG: hypothetical protein [Microvirus sp.]
MLLKPIKKEQITKNFNAVEFYCNDPFRTVPPASFKLNIYYVAIQLQKIRDYLELDLLRINSAYRTKQYNANVGGSSNSNHLTAQAADITQVNYTNDDFYKLILKLVDIGLIPNGEIIKYETFVHYAPEIEVNHLPVLNTSLVYDGFLLRYNSITERQTLKEKPLHLEKLKIRKL